MNTINSKIKGFSFLFCIAFYLNCQLTENGELKVIKIEFCDNFNNQLECTEKKKAKDWLSIPRTKLGKESENWENLGNYLYFHVRETPGILLHFSRNLTAEESKQFKGNFKAYLGINGYEEKMEGLEIGTSNIASFHYLGSLLKDWMRKKGIAKEKVNFDLINPLLLQYRYELPDGTGQSLQRELYLNWSDGDFPK
ncbi:hypothetical protein LPTSP4_06100 [Leptospira ryugenii]|uniref:Uncharacterized protein n=1 Tax=Leptospira ryugenii TaxID=1917863 RepID=A0A2P2DWZ6_9LEPT|nr:hypothetical protein [Leptospira ryugenii]GBF49100.1 hypothetical protein LPTSP4_06100 [Leptospira ryugenii]